MPQRAARGGVALSVLRGVGRLPLGPARALGAGLGWIAYAASPGYRRKIRSNLRRAGLDSLAMRWRVAGEAGRTIGELPWVWTRPLAQVAARVSCSRADLAVLDEAEGAGLGVLFVTPHLGAFDVAARWYATRAPITVLFKPPRKRWLRPLVAFVRERDAMRAVPPTIGGLRAMLRALRDRQAVGLLPDQVPSAGDGRWAPFFGEPAYTMTLPERLVQQTGAQVVVAVCERVRRPRGWRLRLAPMRETPSPDVLNERLQQCILGSPEQYLWGYNRYRRPVGAASHAAAGSTLSGGASGAR
ncbi:MAG TPA: lysophospholipid acyltransferase family protein [Zeimonas sp.]